MKLKNLAFLICTILLFTFTSCVITPDYYLRSAFIDKELKIDQNAKYTLVKNNFVGNVNFLSLQINQDFSQYFKNINFEQQFLEFENSGYVFDLDSDQLKNLKEETTSDFLILIKLITIPNLTQNKTIEIKKISSSTNERKYSIVLNVYDLNQQKMIYTNEAASILKKNTSDTFFGYTDQKTQLLKTYQKVYSHFEKNLTK